MSKRFIVLAFVTAFALAGCASMGPQKRQVGLVEGVVWLPFAIAGAGVQVLTGYDIYLSEADRRIGDYAKKQYGENTHDYYICITGAYGSINDRRSGQYGGFDDYYRRNSSGLQGGRREHDKMVWENCESVGRSLGNSGY